MKFTMDIPLGVIEPAGEFQTFAAIREMAGALESAGVDACYLTDHPAPSSEWLHKNGHDAVDPFTALGFVAAASSKLLLHTNIVVMPYRNPFLTAKAAATLQILSGGRLILGAGAGYQKAEFDALGVDFHKRGKLFDEALETIQLAWGGGVVAKEGTNFNAVEAEPRPVPKPAPLIWIGGGSDKAAERAAKFGDGWSPVFSAPTMSKNNQESGIQSTAQLGQKVSRLNDLRAELGKSGPFDIAIGPRARVKFGSAVGVAEFVDELGELAEVGVTWAMVAPSHQSRQVYLENVQWFGEEVIAKLK